MGSCHSLYKDLAAAGRFNPSKKTSPPVVGEYGGGAATNGAGMVGESKKAEAVAAVWSPRYGSKDETFFDAQAWQDSDCEDFYSVNGEFTPSRGSTPNHQAATPGKGIANMMILNGLGETQGQNESQPSPRKKLAELFRENPNPPGEEESLSKDREGYPTKKKVENATWCCVPSLTFGLGYIERKE